MRAGRAAAGGTRTDASSIRRKHVHQTGKPAGSKPPACAMRPGPAWVGLARPALRGGKGVLNLGGSGRAGFWPAARGPLVGGRPKGLCLVCRCPGGRD